MAHYDDLNTKQIWVVGIISAVLTGVTILAVQVLYYAMLESFEAEVLAKSEYVSSIKHIEDQRAQLGSYGVRVDEETQAKTYQIPIERAIDLLMERGASPGAASEPSAGDTTLFDHDGESFESGNV